MLRSGAKGVLGRANGPVAWPNERAQRRGAPMGLLITEVRLTGTFLPKHSTIDKDDGAPACRVVPTGRDPGPVRSAVEHGLHRRQARPSPRRTAHFPGAALRSCRGAARADRARDTRP